MNFSTVTSLLKLMEEKGYEKKENISLRLYL